MATFLTDDPRPPCIGQLSKGCSMGNTEVLVESMAAKIQVLKERLAATEHRGGHSPEACKLDCLMAILPLLLGGPRAAALAPAMMAPGVPAPDVSHLHSKIASLEADKVKLKAEKEALEQKCKLLESRCEAMEITAAAEAPPVVSFEEIAKASWEDDTGAPPVPAAPSADLQAQLDKVTRERDQAVAALEAEPADDAEVIASLRSQIADCVPLTTFTELKTKSDTANADLAACIEMRDDCIARTRGVPAPVTTTPAPATTEVATAPIAPPEPGQVVMADNDILGQGTCEPLTDAQRTYLVRKWNVNPDPRTGERVPGQTLRSVQAIVSSPLTKPSLDDVGTRDVPVPVKGSLEIDQQFGGHVQRLKEVYQLMRPEIWTGNNCEALQAQYVNDVKTMLVRLACQLLDAITAKAAANNVADQVDGKIPDALKAPCDTTLAGRIAGLAPDVTAQEAGASMVAALERLFLTWMERVEEGTDAGPDIVHGIFCPVLSKAAACVWPLDVAKSQAWGKAWNAAK